MTLIRVTTKELYKHKLKLSALGQTVEVDMKKLEKVTVNNFPRKTCCEAK